MPYGPFALGQHNATVLVIDHDRDILLGVVEVLRKAGFLFVHALQTPATMVERCLSLRPDVVLLGTSGAAGAIPPDALAERAASLIKCAEGKPPVIVVMGDDLPASRQRDAWERGVIAFMRRPPDPMDLLMQVAAAARIRILDLHAGEREVVPLTGRDTGAPAPRHPPSPGDREWLAHAAHEMRTPLNAILGFSDLLRQEAHGPLGDGRYREYAADIHAAAEHMAAVVNGTLEMARAASGKVTLNPQEVELSAIVLSTGRMLDTMAQNCGVTLTVKVPATPLHLRTDPEKIRQIVLNLGSNAIKFTAKGGAVTIEMGPDPDTDGGALILVVRDTGKGMQPHEIPLALQPYWQQAGSQSGPYKGTGLGLPLTKRFVEMLGGTLDISSQPGTGTVVTVRLPPTLL